MVVSTRYISIFAYADSLPCLLVCFLRSSRPSINPPLSTQVRCSKYLYTLCVTDSEKADKLRQSLPPGLQVKDI
jgi:hypothetical protein